MDARDHILKLPSATQANEAWVTATEAVLQAADSGSNGAWMFLARIGMMSAPQPPRPSGAPSERSNRHFALGREAKAEKGCLMPERTNERWTPEDDTKLLALLAARKHIAVVANAMRRTESSIRMRANVLKISLRTRRSKADISGSGNARSPVE